MSCRSAGSKTEQKQNTDHAWQGSFDALEIFFEYDFHRNLLSIQKFFHINVFYFFSSLDAGAQRRQSATSIDQENSRRKVHMPKG